MIEQETPDDGDQKDITNYDAHWKMAITYFFRSFLGLFFPHIEEDIDWSRGWEALDKELVPEQADDEVKLRHADLIFRVYRKGGEESWVVLHVEVQAQQQKDMVLEERVWVYATRIRQRYGKKVCSLVVLADLSPDWRPKRFREELWGFELSARFPTAKLLDFEKRLKAEPQLSANPFALIVQFHLAAKRSSPASEERRAYKRAFFLELLRAVRDGRLDTENMQEVRKILMLLDGFLSLSAENDKLFEDDLHQSKEIQDMKREPLPYLTIFERWAVKEERERLEKEHAKQLEEERRRAEDGRRQLEDELAHLKLELEALRRGEQGQDAGDELGSAGVGEGAG